MKAMNLFPVAGTSGTEGYQGSKAYAWTVFALTFGLMLSDYLSRQVMGAVFPFLKVTWGVSDSQLGALVSIVALVVGLLTVPLSLVADRWGRVKSITLMAFVWCLATIACGLANNYTEMLIARAMVGFGEAAYAAAGAALLAHTFPVGKRSAVLGAFQSAGVFGAVLGVVLGSTIATQFGWRYAFFAVGLPGLILAVLYPFFVRDYQVPARRDHVNSGGSVTPSLSFSQIARQVFAARSGNFTVVAFGLQMGMPAILIAWVPTFFNRFYGFDPKKAGLMAAVVVLALGIGMLFGGGIAEQRTTQVSCSGACGLCLDLRCDACRGVFAASRTAWSGVADCGGALRSRSRRLRGSDVDRRDESRGARHRHGDRRVGGKLAGYRSGPIPGRASVRRHEHADRAYRCAAHISCRRGNVFPCIALLRNRYCREAVSPHVAPWAANR
jgi:MFS family permease